MQKNADLNNKKQQRLINYYSADNSQREQAQNSQGNINVSQTQASPTQKRKSPTKRQEILLNTSLNQIYVKDPQNATAGQNTK